MNTNPNSKIDQENQSETTFSMLLASSIHDVKNVLSSVLESVDWMIYQSKPTPEQEKELQKINQLVVLANTELMQLLCIYKYENQQFSSMKTAVLLEEFLEMQVAFLTPLLSGKNISIDYECDNDAEGLFDETLLASAIRNAAVNAIKFATSRILIKAEKEQDTLIFSIEDDGPGFPKEMIGPIQDRKASVNFNTGSTGLGLYFAEIVANLHHTPKKNATVCLAQSHQLGGAAFIFRLPQA